MGINQWMSWEGGVDLVAVTGPASMPNVIVHVARMVHTPAGSAPAGMVLWQPEANAAPLLCGFVCPDAAVGAYFGSNIFAGTPFENAPVLAARMEFSFTGDQASARVETAGHVFEVLLASLGHSGIIHRAPSGMAPFTQQGLERVAARADLMIDGQTVAITVPPTGISGGPAAVFSPCGIYAR